MEIIQPEVSEAIEAERCQQHDRQRCKHAIPGKLGHRSSIHGDSFSTPASLFRREMGRASRVEIASEVFAIDRLTHSLFDTWKATLDILAQNYVHYCWMLPAHYSDPQKTGKHFSRRGIANPGHENIGKIASAQQTRPS